MADTPTPTSVTSVRHTITLPSDPTSVLQPTIEISSNGKVKVEGASFILTLDDLRAFHTLLSAALASPPPSR